MKKYLLSIVGVLMLATPALPAGYGDAGCGLGSIVFEGKTDTVSQVLAATTNGTSYSQIFGITTGTSNCDASGIILAERESEIFVAQNLDSLAKEMASGNGEHVATLSGLMGCPTATFASFTQQNFEVIYADANIGAGQMLTALNTAISNDPVLSTSCTQ